MSIGIFQILIFIVLAFLFFLPTYIAIKKNHQYKVPIILINLFLGLFWGIGWIVALIWAIMGDSSDRAIQPIMVDSSSPAQEIERLHKLKQDGVLTEDEYKRQKQAILGKK